MASDRYGIVLLQMAYGLNCPHLTSPAKNTGTFQGGTNFLDYIIFNQRLSLLLVRCNCIGAINIHFQQANRMRLVAGNSLNPECKPDH